MRFKRVEMAVVIGAMLGSVSVLSPLSAGAVGDITCPHGGNATDSACYHDNLPYYGGYTEFNNVSAYVSPAYLAEGKHINDTIWLYSGASSSDWLEEGYTFGWEGSSGYYWYDASGINNGAEYQEHLIGSTSANGSHNDYWLRYDGVAPNGTGQFSVYLDGIDEMYFQGLGFGGSLVQAGLEVGAGLGPVEPDPNFSASTFANSPLAWQDTSRTFHYGWTTAEYWRDFPCGTYPQGYCTNGLFYGNSNWSDNKP